jgi:hypothetical protein
VEVKTQTQSQAPQPNILHHPPSVGRAETELPPAPTASAAGACAVMHPHADPQLQLLQMELRKHESGSIVTLLMVCAVGGGAGGGESRLGGGHTYGHRLGSLLHGREQGRAGLGVRRWQQGDGDGEGEGGDINSCLCCCPRGQCSRPRRGIPCPPSPDP